MNTPPEHLDPRAVVIGAELREAMKAKGYSENSFSKAIGMSRSTLRNTLDGTRSSLPMRDFLKITTALDADEAAILAKAKAA